MRARSSNRLLVEAAQAIAGNGTVSIYEQLAELPFFNPDQDSEAMLPEPARTLREQVQGARALLVSVPEYAHGIPGAFKNALDWLVGSTALMNKPVAIWSATTRTTHAPAQLREVLRTMAASVDESASVAMDVPGSVRSPSELLEAEGTRAMLDEAIGRLLVSGRADRPYPP